MAPPATSVVGYLLLGPSDTGAAGIDPAALLDALGAHSPTIEPDLPDGCWLDLRAGRRAPAIVTRAADLLATAREWGHATARLGVAPTPGVARLAARHGATDATVLADATAITAFLSPLSPMDAGLDAADADRLALVGLRTLGAVAALSRGTLGDYLGLTGPALEALARGQDDRPLVPTRPSLVLAARRELDYALDDRDALVRLLDELLAPLLAYYRQRGLGATRATLTLGRAGAKPTATAVVLPAATTAVARVRETLVAALPAGGRAGPHGGGDDAAPGGFTLVGVAVSAPRQPVGRQSSFYDVPTGRAALAVAGVREGRRRGDGPIGHLRLVDPSHPDPERRYALTEAEPTDDAPVGEAAT